MRTRAGTISWTRQYDGAIEPLLKTIEMDTNFPVGQWYLGLAYEQKGAFQDAIAQFQNCVRITAGRPSMLALLGHAYAVANQRSEALEDTPATQRAVRTKVCAPNPALRTCSAG